MRLPPEADHYDEPKKFKGLWTGNTLEEMRIAQQALECVLDWKVLWLMPQSTRSIYDGID